LEPGLPLLVGAAGLHRELVQRRRGGQHRRVLDHGLRYVLALSGRRFLRLQAIHRVEHFAEALGPARIRGDPL
jgi:hypothetical protein